MNGIHNKFNNINLNNYMDVKKAKKKPELQEQLFVGNYIDVYHPASKH